MQHLSSRQLFITNPSPSIGLKKSVDFIFQNLRDNFIFSETPGQNIKIRDVWHVCLKLMVQTFVLIVANC